MWRLSVKMINNYEDFLAINYKHRKADIFGKEAVTLRVITLKGSGEAEVIIKCSGKRVVESINDIITKVRLTRTWITNPSAIADFNSFKKKEKPNQKYFRIPVEWTCYDTIEVAADSFEDAIQYVLDNDGSIPLGDAPEYMDGSWKIAVSTWDTGDAKAIAEELESYYGEDDKNLRMISINYVN